MGCAGGGHPALGVCAAVTKCSAQGDLTYSFGPRQAHLPEGTSVCVVGGWRLLRLPAAENLLSLRWASQARPGALSGCEMRPITLSQQGGSVKWMLGPALHQADTWVFVRGKGTGSSVSGEEPGTGTEWPWVLRLQLPGPSAWRPQELP